MEQHADHRAAIVAGSEPKDQRLVCQTGFWRGTSEPLSPEAATFSTSGRRNHNGSASITCADLTLRFALQGNHRQITCMTLRWIWPRFCDRLRATGLCRVGCGVANGQRSQMLTRLRGRTRSQEPLVFHTSARNLRRHRARVRKRPNQRATGIPAVRGSRAERGPGGC